MSDSYGDGMCCLYGDGTYRVLSDGEVVASGGTFTSEEVTEFGNTCGIDPDEPAEPEQPEDPEQPEGPEPTGYPSGTTEFKALVNADTYLSESSWTLHTGSGATIHSSNGFTAHNESFEASYCIPTNDCYTFVMVDSFGDGMCCGFGQGSFSVIWGERNHDTACQVEID